MKAAERLCGRIVEATGWTFGDLDRLSMVEVRQLVAYWKDCPPLADCVRAYLGIRRDEEVDVEQEDVEPLRELSEEEWEQKRNGLKAYAARHGGPRNGAARG